MYYPHSLLCVLLVFTLSLVDAHMNINNICVRGAAWSPCNKLPGAVIDYNLNAPIGTHSSKNQPFCKYTTPYPSPVATYAAGSSIQVTFGNGAIHSGGHCQFAVSYDGGQTFVVLLTVMKTCFLNGLSFNVPLPITAPSSDKVVFAWAWNNAVGNRELYSNCWDARVNGLAANGYVTGPKLLMANYGPESPYIPEFPPSNDDGSQYYSARPTITVTYNGPPPSSTYSSSSSTPISTTSLSTTSSSSSTPPVTSVTSSTPPSSTTSSSVPVPTSCSPEGGYRCVAAGTAPGYQVCSNGQWVGGACSPGTVCRTNGNSIYCDWSV